MELDHECKQINNLHQHKSVLWWPSYLWISAPTSSRAKKQLRRLWADIYGPFSVILLLFPANSAPGNTTVHSVQCNGSKYLVYRENIDINYAFRLKNKINNLLMNEVWSECVIDTISTSTILLQQLRNTQHSNDLLQFIFFLSVLS